MINIESKSLFFVGDIHGNYSAVVGFIKRYNIKDSVLIFCGDCGFGFESPSHYEQQIFPYLKRVLSPRNNYCIFVRGNHDDPELFNTFRYDYKRIKLVPDYTVVSVRCGNELKNVLCIGGAVSLDRSNRISIMKRNAQNYSIHHGCGFEVALNNTRKYYWARENCIYNEKKLKEISVPIHAVASHSCPSICSPQSKSAVVQWADIEKQLGLPELVGRDLCGDIEVERNTMTQVYDFLIAHEHPIRDWCYGHFHYHENTQIKDTFFHLLDMERRGNLDVFTIDLMRLEKNI